jgi:HD-GYP domain-containing protein (c-di-GMP phosphodiesterase class II)
MDNLIVEAAAAGELSIDLLGNELVENARERATRRLGRIEERVAVAMAVSFLAAAGCVAAFMPAVRPLSPTAAVLAVLAYAIASRVQFEVRNNFAQTTQLVLVPMLLVLPPRDVPLFVAAGYVLGQLRWRTHPLSHTPIDVANAWYSIGPAVVLSVGAASRPAWTHAPLYAAALAAQLAVDFATTATWSRIAYRVRVGDHLRSMRETALVDVALSPIALGLGLATAGRSWGTLLALPLVGLLHVFAQERQRRLDHALELQSAYRGTAMLLGEMIEADDAYTGSHSRDVVELVLAVCDRLGLDARARRHAEFAALLHDVGKVKIPPEIINKPGPLDDAERALMNLHTVVGEEMLGQVGGLLGEVGRIVRSSHERWDGGGYPDGLAGEGVPVAARIVAACDAWSAMTTDRSYRVRLSHEQAVAELRACAGTQFDPRVVDALLSVLEG